MTMTELEAFVMGMSNRKWVYWCCFQDGRPIFKYSSSYCDVQLYKSKDEATENAEKDDDIRRVELRETEPKRRVKIKKGWHE